MLLDKKGKLVKSLDFRGTSIELLDNLTAKELFRIMCSAQQEVNLKERFKATDLIPENWKGTVYEPIFTACAKGNRGNALRLMGVIIKQALIMTPLLFSQIDSGEYEATTYVKETLKF